MYNMHKQKGFWTVVLESSGLVLFRSLSRKTATEWKNRESMETLPEAFKDVTQQVVDKLNVECGARVWRKGAAK